MQRADNFGFSSLVFGVLSVIGTVAANQLELLRPPGSGYVLNFIERLGLVREAKQGAYAEIANSSLLTITDGSSIATLSFFSGYLALVAVCFSIWAEWREEDSLYLSAGFVCGAMALFLFHKVTGVSVTAVGTLAVLALRRRRGA